MRKIFSLVLYLFLSVCLFGCSANSDADYYDDASGTGESSSGDELSNNFDVQSGLLTAASLNDFNDFAYFMNLTKEYTYTFEDAQDVATDGVFETIHKMGYFSFDETICVNTKDSNNVALRGVKIELFLDSTLIYTNYSNVYGEVNILISDQYLTDYLIKATYLDEIKEYNVENLEPIVFEFNSVNVNYNKLDIAFLIDTTGSMGDELDYIKVELIDVINNVKNQFASCDIRLAFVFYRDTTDDYVVKSVDFSNDIDSVIATLKLQTANGGGDFPEAVHSGLAEVNKLSWRTDSDVTKILFHVLDAPPHDDAMQEYVEEVYLLAQNGIVCTPIASSGIDKDTEYLLRCQAMVTNADYVFLTDDSGIGESHVTPSIKDYDVEYLNDLLIRLITQYHSGEKLDKIIVE